MNARFQKVIIYLKYTRKVSFDDNPQCKIFRQHFSGFKNVKTSNKVKLTMLPRDCFHIEEGVLRYQQK